MGRPERGRRAAARATRYLFRGSGNAARIDRITTLTALDKPVTFRDNKEGLIGLRVARTLEQPVDKPELYTDADGKPTKIPVVDNTGVAGHYRAARASRATPSGARAAGGAS